MREYPKIQSVFKRYQEGENKGKFIIDKYSLPEFEFLKNNIWEMTEKIDGTNIRIKWNGEKISFGGKTDNAQIPTFLYDKLESIFRSQIDNFKRIFKDEEICMHGEGFGSKIQKGGGNYISDGVDFILFDIKIGDWWLKREDIEEIANEFTIKVVPIIEEGTLERALFLVKNGFHSTFGSFIAEGLVLKPKVQLFSRMGKRIITKVKYKDF
jgi:hypothetical protein